MLFVLIPVGVNIVLKFLGTDRKTRIGMAIGMLALMISLSGLAVKKYSHYIRENYGTVHEADYLDYEVVKPDIAVKHLSYPHKTWFQHFLKTDAAFGSFYYGLSYSQIDFWRMEKVPADWWRDRFWNVLVMIRQIAELCITLPFAVWGLAMFLNGVQIRPDTEENDTDIEV